MIRLKLLRGILGGAGVAAGALAAIQACSSASPSVPVLPGQGGGDSGIVLPTEDATTSSDGSRSSTVDSSAPADAMQCEGGGVICSGLCTNTQSDPNNCGKCGNTCGPMGTTVQCIQGTCQCPADAGETLCGSACVDILTDQHNCGQCGHTCQVSGNPTACMGGYCQPTIVAQPNATIWGLVVDQTQVWWTQPAAPSAPGTGALLRKAFASGSTIETVLSSLNDPRGLAIDPGSSPHWVYWVDYYDTGVRQWYVTNGHQTQDYPLMADGGNVPPVYRNPIGVAADGTNVYWASNFDNSILSVPEGNPNGVPATVIASNEDHPYGIATDGKNVYWTDQGHTGTDGSVVQAPIGGGTPTTLASGEANPQGIAVDGTNVYWTDTVNPGWVKQVPIGGGTIVTLAGASAPEGAPTGIAVDAKNVYWTSFNDNTVNGVPIGGGTKFTYAINQNGPSAIAVDSLNVYWVSTTSGTISEVTK